MSEQVYEIPDSLNAPADFKTWCHHVDHHMTTLFGIDAREAGFDKDELRDIHKKHETLGGSLEFVEHWGEKQGLSRLGDPFEPAPPSRPPVFRR